MINRAVSFLSKTQSFLSLSSSFLFLHQITMAVMNINWNSTRFSNASIHPFSLQQSIHFPVFFALSMAITRLPFLNWTLFFISSSSLQLSFPRIPTTAARWIHSLFSSEMRLQIDWSQSEAVRFSISAMGRPFACLWANPIGIHLFRLSSIRNPTDRTCSVAPRFRFVFSFFFLFFRSYTWLGRSSSDLRLSSVTNRRRKKRKSTRRERGGSSRRLPAVRRRNARRFAVAVHGRCWTSWYLPSTGCRRGSAGRR